VLPSAALGYQAGGAMAVVKDDQKGVKAAERFFEIRVIPDAASKVQLHSGQRVIVRLVMPPKPIALQAWRCSCRSYRNGSSSDMTDAPSTTWRMLAKGPEASGCPPGSTPCGSPPPASP